MFTHSPAFDLAGALDSALPLTLSAAPPFSPIVDPACRALLAMAGDDDKGRRLAMSLLLTAVFDAHAGDMGAAHWLESDFAHRLADAVGLRRWPPSEDELAIASRKETRHRARELNEEESIGLRELSASAMRSSRARRAGAGQVAR